MTDIKLIDTNILVYAYDSSEKIKHKIAKNILKKCWNKEEIYALSVQNLSESFVIATKKIQNPVPIEEIEEDINDMISFSNFKILPISTNDISNAIKLVSQFKIDYWDSLIVSVMRENNINEIITENEKDFKKIPWIKIVNPFLK